MRRLLCLAVVLVLCGGCAMGETLNVMVYDREDMPEEYGTPVNNQWTRFLREKCLDELGLDVTYTAVSRNNDAKEITVLLASANPPDILFAYDHDMWLRFCESGLLMDLTEPLAQYGPNILKNQADVLPYGKYQGRQYAICNERGSTEVTSGFIRQDWLDRIGVQPARSEDGHLMMTTDELYDVLAAFRDQGLCGRQDGSVFLSYGSTYWPILLILEAFYEEDQITAEDLYALPNFLYAGAREGYRYLNRLYNAGLMNADFAFIGDNDKSAYIQKIVSGQAGFWINDSWFGFFDDTYSRLMEQDPDAAVAAVDLIGPGRQPSYKYTYNDYGLMIFVPARSAHVGAAIKYLDYLSRPENDMILRYGFENEHYILSDDGFPMTKDREHNRATRVDVSDLALMYNGNVYLGNADAALNLQMLPEALRGLRKQAHNVALTHSFQLPVTDRYLTVSSSQQYLLEEKERALRFRTIMCAAEDFDRVWEACVADYLNCGGSDIIGQKRALFQRYAEASEE